MTDHFALLGEPRRPWLDPAALKEKFLALSSEAHPDRLTAASETDRQAASARFAGLNEAYQCLREPRSRLRHLLELELGAKPAGIERSPAAMMELFMDAGRLCRDVDAFLDKRAGITSPLLKAEMLARGLEWTDQLNQLRQTLQTRCGALEEQLKTMNVAWERAPSMGDAGRTAGLPLGSLEEIYRELSYLTRWTAQLQERAVQLAL